MNEELVCESSKEKESRRENDLPMNISINSIL